MTKFDGRFKKMVLGPKAFDGPVLWQQNAIEADGIIVAEEMESGWQHSSEDVVEDAEDQEDDVESQDKKMERNLEMV